MVEHPTYPLYPQQVNSWIIKMDLFKNGFTGDAVSVTSSENLFLGSKFLSRSTGIILNNVMDDFSYPGVLNRFGVPPSESNMMRPGNRPVSSMSPTVVVDEKDRVVAVVGGSGGTKIIPAVAQVSL